MPSLPLPTGVVTFVFTDIEGSTRLVQQLGAQAYGELLERHRSALRDAFRACDGVEVGTEGDSVFAVFARPAAAVEAAAAGQRRLAATDWPPDAPIRVRIGLHTGEGTLVGGTYVGNDVNRAARISAAGHGGQVLLSETTSALVADELPADLGLRDLGRHRLKDLRPERLCQLLIAGLPDEFPSIRSLDVRPNNLPTQLTSFVGRRRELAEAAALLETSRLLTVTGPGGTGKTRLSLQLAAEVADRFPDGTFFVALEPVRDPALVAPRIAAAVGLVETGSRSASELLVEWLAGRRVLLVLDNFEQALGGAGVVGEMLRAAEGLSIVATSRAPLHVSGEQEYPLDGLPTPPDPTALDPFERARLPGELRVFDSSSVGQYESVRLFVSRAAAVRPGFAITADNAAAVATICARLHGMPLAIELAAARVKILAPDAILNRLGRQLQLLAGGARDLPERQQTLRGAIAWSYDLLDDPLRRLLDRLSVFVGGWDLASAEAVCGPATELGVEVLDGLTALVDHSLVRSDDAADEARFRLLETIREFAAERLAMRPDAAEIGLRHTRAFLDLAEEAASHLSGTEQREWLDRLSREHDNLRAALDRAVEAADGDAAPRLAFALWRFWQKRGHLREARRRLESIAAQPWAREDPARWARLNEALGGVAWWQADLARLGDFYEEALRVWRELGDRHEIANALYNASFPHIFPNGSAVNDPDPTGQGLRNCLEALALYEELGDRVGIANVEWAIGNYHYFRGHLQYGEDYFRRALDLFREAGDRTMEAWAEHMLGSGLLRQGRVAEAREVIRHAARQFHAAGDSAGLTLVLDDLSALAIAEGDLPRAARIRGAARSLTRETGAGLAEFVEDAFEQNVRPSARSVMAPDELERYAAEGAAMSLDEAVAYALEATAGAEVTEAPAGR